MTIEIKNLTKKINDKKALDNIDLNFQKGLHVLMGSGASGKTTLIKI
ncbi:hypothetical protein [Treponema phagedenis]|uniref:Uncharacterized protein n=1 Tax=Treponema phagedenis TaxID=162 RepID=A0A0B7GVZ1_TREPH|nr:hypothetical protein [Treponema phagedenis]EFW38210.1 hypothetical protein HMPREF9554_01294 [Treponema phagedenis F0421]NVP23180.1 hypothetical protein [Treponema phagedenis]QKS92113.1 hypothetical protein HPJ96_05755 [Treponema phagedenis]QLC58043.1 hypothetical protein HW453_03910 [Treponema phagedenis]CEM62668.1 conserved hypothetical protein [Treponema phagedenis]